MLRGSYDHHGIKGKKGQIFFATGIVFRVFTHKMTVRERGAPSEALPKSIWVTAAEESSLAGARQRGRTGRDVAVEV